MLPHFGVTKGTSSDYALLRQRVTVRQIFFIYSLQMTETEHPEGHWLNVNFLVCQGPALAGPDTSKLAAS